MSNKNRFVVFNTIKNANFEHIHHNTNLLIVVVVTVIT